MATGFVVDSRALSKNYASITALDAVTFNVRPGEIFGFIGADGAGKTTAFRIMGGVLERHPTLKVVFLESGCGWAAFWPARAPRSRSPTSVTSSRPAEDSSR